MIINLDRSGRVRLQRQRTYETEDADVFVVAQVERREAEEEQERHQDLKKKVDVPNLKINRETSGCGFKRRLRKP